MAQEEDANLAALKKRGVRLGSEVGPAPSLPLAPTGAREPPPSIRPQQPHPHTRSFRVRHEIDSKHQLDSSAGASTQAVCTRRRRPSS